MVTESGELAETKGVKWLFHAAAVTGQITRGYRPIADVNVCVRNALEKVDSEESKARYEKGDEPRSILFPLFGTGQANADPEDSVLGLIGTVLAYLARTPETLLSDIWFLAFTDADVKVCTRVLESLPELTRIDPPKGTPES